MKIRCEEGDCVSKATGKYTEQILIPTIRYLCKKHAKEICVLSYEPIFQGKTK